MDRKPVFRVSDLFNLNKPMAKVTLRSGAVMGREIEQDPTTQPNCNQRMASGQEYARKYVEEEERLLIEGDRNIINQGLELPDSLTHKFCEMEDISSIGTTPNLADVDSEEYLQLYERYNFTPKQIDQDKELPIEKDRDLIVRMVETNQVVVVVGSTGCGKTTQLPQFILDQHAKQKKRCKIIVTQPRRIAATSVAERVCYERGWELGTIVGYQIGLDNKTSPDTCLTYCTTGVLREKLVKERSMMNYTHVIIDEVHERDLETDFIMLIVRKLLRTNSRTVKVVLMSATIDPSHFAKYFSLPIGRSLVPAPVLQVTSATRYKVDVWYYDKLTDLGDVPEFDFANPHIDEVTYTLAVGLIMNLDKIDAEAFYIAKKRHPKPKELTKRPVLVFLPGIHEIETMYELLSKKREENPKYKWILLPLHSSITRDQQNRVFVNATEDYRKVILSTNIAESSITVEHVEYVIDFCLTKHLVCDPRTYFTSLSYAWAAHSNCTQRAGRTGRTNTGRVYRLVPEHFYETALPHETEPEMTRCPLTTTVLKAKLLKMGGPEAVLANALDPPDLGCLETTILVLKEAGALLMTSAGKPSRFDGDITFLGTVMSHIPLDIHLTKMIMLGNAFSVLDDAIVMAAWMSVRNVFRNDFYDRLGPYASKISFTGGSNSDCIAYLHVYRTFAEKHRTGYFRTSSDSEDGWCKRNFLNRKAMYEANQLVEELRKRLKDLGVYEIVSDNRIKWEKEVLPLIRKVVIAGALYPNYYVRSADFGKVDEQDAFRAVAGKDFNTTVYLQGLPSDQPGELYARVVKDILERWAGVVSNVSFDGSSKVYVEFQREKSKDLPGRISYPVYRAVKMRQLKIPVEIPLLVPEVAQKRVQKLGIVSDRLLSLGKPEGPQGNRFPDWTVKEVKFTACYSSDPNKFWIQEIGVQTELNSCQKRLNTPGQVFSISHKPKVGEIYAAPYPQNSGILYRAVVCSISRSMDSIASVFFIDYGNVDDALPIKYLCELGPELEDLRSTSSVPPFALECTLTGIGPSPITNKNGVWSKIANDKFAEMISKGVMVGEVFSVVDGVLSLIVKQKEKSMNDILVDKGLAIKVDESYRSKLDNTSRVSARHSNIEKKGGLNLEVSYGLRIVDNYLDPPSREECQKPIRLRGPSSPLEMKLFGCTRASVGKEIRLDTESVNSVLLDSNPEDPHERLLVAGFVATNPQGTSLKLGHTTLMPNIHGLSSLIFLIFSPTVELRRNIAKTHYTGALCGLGYDKETGESYFPENDMEIVFDCTIDLTDMQYVNKLRYWISKPLMTEEGVEDCDCTPAEIVEAQKKVHENFMKLLKRHRESKDREYFSHSHRWHQFNIADLLSPDFVVHRAVYRAHNALATND